MKEEVLGTLDFDHFTTKELASDVRKSGLFSADKIIERMEQLFENKNSELEAKKTENDQLKNDMKTVKSNLSITVPKSLACRHDCYSPSSIYGTCTCSFNPWTKYVTGDVKSRYGHI